MKQMTLVALTFIKHRKNVGRAWSSNTTPRLSAPIATNWVTGGWHTKVNHSSYHYKSLGRLLIYPFPDLHSLPISHRTIHVHLTLSLIQTHSNASAVVNCYKQCDNRTNYSWWAMCPLATICSTLFNNFNLWGSHFAWIYNFAFSNRLHKHSVV